MKTPSPPPARLVPIAEAPSLRHADFADLYVGAAGWAAFGQSDYVLNLDPPPGRPEADTPLFTLLRRDLLGQTKPLGILADLMLKHSPKNAA